jgi:hypothetical protein
MTEEMSEYLSILMAAAAIGYMFYEIDRRRRKLHEIFDVLDAGDVHLTTRLEDMVERGELQPYTEATLG